MGRISKARDQAIKAWRAVSNVDTIWSLIDRIGAREMVSGAGAIAMAALGYIREFDPILIALIGIFSLGGILWVWNQVTIRRGLRDRTIDEKVAGQGGQHPIPGALNATLEGVSLNAVETAEINELYVGNIIASAANLHDRHRLELAVVGFNGTSESILVKDVAGHIKAGSGNLRDMVALETPTIRSSAITAPGGEIILVLIQALKTSEADEFRAALESNNRLQLDLQSLHITVASVSDVSRSTRLPLWDAVALERRDDIVSNRVTIMGIQAAADVKVSLGMVVARVDGTTEERDA